MRWLFLPDSNWLVLSDYYWLILPDANNNARAALACILPHVRAYADEVEPLMTIWDGHKRNSTVIVRLELTDEPLDNILDEVHELLKRATNRRGVTSVVEEG